jgi:transcriptional regulator with XRE-family HTH domain
METIGAKIVEIRKRKGYTQEQLSDLSKINLRTLQRIEKGTTEPRSETLSNICQVLEVNMEDLLDYGKKDDMKFLKYFHLSVLTCLFFPLGSVLLPMILWLTKRDRIIGLEEQGLNVLNYQILWSILFYLSFTVWGFLRICHWSHADLFLYLGGIIYIPNVFYPIFIARQISKGVLRKFYFTPIAFLK